MAKEIENTTVTESNETNINWLWMIIGVAGLAFGLIIGWLIINFFAQPYTYHGTLIDSPQPVKNFTLTGHNGEQVSLNDFRGKAVVMYFGYTFCPDVCPATMVELAKANEALGNDVDQVQMMMITVDPERDTPQVMEEYVTHFDPQFLGLTGSLEEIASVANPLGIYVKKHEGTVATGYLIDHTASVLVIDPEGFLRLGFPFNTPGENIAEDISHLIREY